jgi:hypothetical protein
MMRSVFLAAALLAGAASFAQNDSTRYINGLPVTEDDTARAFPQQDLEPKTHLRVVSPDKLPEKLLKTLQDEEQYLGWSDTTVYYDENIDLYLVHVKREDGVQIYGMTDKGKPVTFNQVSVSRQ